MAKLKPEAELALHEFSVRYRAAIAKKHPATQQDIDAVKDAVRGQYEQEQEAKQGQKIEPSAPSKEREPDEPER